MQTWKRLAFTDAEDREGGSGGTPPDLVACLSNPATVLRAPRRVRIAPRATLNPPNQPPAERRRITLRMIDLTIRSAVAGDSAPGVQALPFGNQTP